MEEFNELKEKDIANTLKITQQQYSLYEKGIRDIPVDLLIKLSKFYNVSTDYILGLTNYKK